jgi:hypothetical protein
VNARERNALEEALIAIDGSVNTLVMARIMVLRSLEAADGPETDPDGRCTHHELLDAAGGVSVCAECGENIGPDGE